MGATISVAAQVPVKLITANHGETELKAGERDAAQDRNRNPALHAPLAQARGALGDQSAAPPIEAAQLFEASGVAPNKSGVPACRALTFPRERAHAMARWVYEHSVRSEVLGYAALVNATPELQVSAGFQLGIKWTDGREQVRPHGQTARGDEVKP
jgi:hypothetical protein